MTLQLSGMLNLRLKHHTQSEQCCVNKGKLCLLRQQNEGFYKTCHIRTPWCCPFTESLNIQAEHVKSNASLGQMNTATITNLSGGQICSGLLLRVGIIRQRTVLPNSDP